MEVGGTSKGRVQSACLCEPPGFESLEDSPIEDSSGGGEFESPPHFHFIAGLFRRELPLTVASLAITY